jgi:hypothetical protein
MLITTMTRKQVVIPLANITCAKAVEGGYIVTDAQGEDHNVDKIAWEIAVEGTPVATTPALQGTYLINPGDGEADSPKVWKSNVLGWMVCADTAVRPMVLDPEALLSNPWQVLHPDGRVERSDGRSWDSLDEWLDEVRRLDAAA